MRLSYGFDIRNLDYFGAIKFFLCQRVCDFFLVDRFSELVNTGEKNYSFVGHNISPGLTVLSILILAQFSELVNTV